MKPIRVLQVLTIMNRGGAETMIMNYYRNMDRAKVQFDFLLHRMEHGVFDEEIERLGGRIHRLSNISFKNLSDYKKSLNIFFKENPEYKIVHSHLNALSVFVLRAAKNNSVPVRIAHSHTSLYNLNINPFSKKRHSLSFILKFVAQNYFKIKVPNYANYYYACGEKAGVWLYGKKNKSKIKIINNAIDAAQYSYDPKISTSIKEKLDLSHKFVIGHVGNFVPEKNHAFIIKVFNEIQKIDKSAVLILVGGGDRANYEKMVKVLKLENNVMFLGVRPDVNNLLQAMDVFLFPSTNEGLPVTLIEAQASGLKIFASDEVSNELNITGLVDFVALKNPASFWANLILNSKSYHRKNTIESIINGDYDINKNASLLQEFYLKNT
ncbi:glycosyltransferase [Gaetbulibacter aquiaggeris]|uniref:Glycosyltransferase n=1 Tax=Gaetbulibacter aquiaggeris TaxID=1735373 RepID=A0ABW7MU63_9FLAO